MTEEQKARALALCRNDRIMTAYGDGVVCYVDDSDGRGVYVPDLSGDDGEVEGRLHRVLEKLVGCSVAVTIGVPFFSVLAMHERAVNGRPHPEGRDVWHADITNRRRSAIERDWHPTRLDAIVAALLSLEAGR